MTEEDKNDVRKNVLIELINFFTNRISWAFWREEFLQDLTEGSNADIANKWLQEIFKENPWLREEFREAMKGRD